MELLMIIRGQFNKLIGYETTLSKKRMEMCRLCPLAHTNQKFTDTCLKEKGGCGCTLSAAVTVFKKECPKKVWYENKLDYDSLHLLRRSETFN